ncbi:cephalosporin hydroxylase [Thiohalocapsa halophila]|uniref:Cephalosporin hydroxylase n=1 Tax=Thiohalocapsa halophila TaxID=69359 RepID=A0ABS1CJ81_9GAMM|nr:cephalosporin hydroxylase family protein [Thiohalocapsa halophila]MBK1631883.1 cephalosporin hydroxylase [Thiohalocapsa halophila]
MSAFDKEVALRVAENGLNASLIDAAQQFLLASTKPKYCYNFSWQGRPIIQYPQDIVGMQELIWSVKPDLVIETGIAHGGSLIFTASMLALLDYCDAVEQNATLDPAVPRRRVLGIDIDIRTHNRAAIEAHPMFHRIDMIEGSSIAPDVVRKVQDISANYSRIMVCLDSNHTHEHVLAELEAYAPLTSVGSYCVVFDTIIDDFPADTYPDRPWGPGNNPKTALRDYLKRHSGFTIDAEMDNKLLITVAPSGFLRRNY